MYTLISNCEPQSRLGVRYAVRARKHIAGLCACLMFMCEEICKIGLALAGCNASPIAGICHNGMWIGSTCCVCARRVLWGVVCVCVGLDNLASCWRRSVVVVGIYMSSNDYTIRHTRIHRDGCTWKCRHHLASSTYKVLSDWVKYSELTTLYRQGDEGFDIAEALSDEADRNN